MILMIDNYDSFTYNLVQMFEHMNLEVGVYRNDSLDLARLKGMAPQAVVISPGPGRPEDAGISIEAIRFYGPRVPLLGVCLGHQAIAEAFG
ncbi:MAG: aminodeoxychorismate/anthranilate synthase component II, partial [Pseudomonadota bacterium]